MIDWLKNKTPINWELAGNPVNWIIVLLMVMIAGLALNLAFSQAENTEG